MSLENPAFIVKGDDGEEYGPVELAELREWVRENRAGLGTIVRLDDANASWQHWESFPELVALLAEVQATGSALSADLAPAPFGKRMLACVLDIILSSILASPIINVVMALSVPDWEKQFMNVLLQPESPILPELRFYMTIGSLILYTILALYMTGFYAAHGKTPGKAVLRLRVVDQDGKKPSLTRSLLRGIGFALSVYFLGLPFIYAFFNPQRRAFHYYIAGTYVVKA